MMLGLQIQSTNENNRKQSLYTLQQVQVISLKIPTMGKNSQVTNNRGEK